MATYYVDGAVGNNGNPGTSPGAGNAWATIQFAADTAVAGDKVWVKASATYTGPIDFDTNAGTGASRIVFEGYTSTTGDGGRATISSGGSSASVLVHNGTADFVTMKNFVLTNATSECVKATANTDYLQFENCRFLKGSSTPSTAFSAGGYFLFRNLSLVRCEISGGFSGNGINGANGLYVEGCVIKDCGGDGINIGSYCSIITIKDSVIAGNGDDGIVVAGSTGPLFFTGNTIDANGGDGIDIHGSNNLMVVVRNNLITNHSGFGDTGLKVGSLVGTTSLNCDYNGYYNNNPNTSGTDTSGAHDVLLTADPYTNAASDNWTLNTTAGGGAAARAAGFPGDIDGTNIGYKDIGALQHADPAGGGSSGGATMGSLVIQANQLISY